MRQRVEDFFWSGAGLVVVMLIALLLIVGGALALDAITTSPNERSRARIAELEQRLAELENK